MDGKRRQPVISTKLVQVRNINVILEENHIEKIDFMDIDAEGFDERIVYSFNWKKYHPRCVLIELLGQRDIEAVIQTPIHKKMKEEGYILKCFYTVTALYVNTDSL
ncbi:MAG: FkbM family methyltransferase [Ruminococcus flavefaciens]|nr:FkbM family methyltransferase [Ruminococcus flavefaciens]